jgi:uncharacterized membrane protein YphA (DoxX/SURF4 family)
MDLTLWIVAGVLALAFIGAGGMKLAQPREKLAASGMGWVEDFNQQSVRLIGVLEVLAAIGLVVPPLVNVAPVLAPLAAVGLVLLMAGAAITHARRKEPQMIVANLVLLVLAAFVAVGRFALVPFGA